jgi:two-component system sensor histidine kinase AlgZ
VEDHFGHLVDPRSAPAAGIVNPGAASSIPMPLPPWRMSLAAALPIGLCLLVMALPAVGHGHALAYRTLYLLANAAWVPVLIWLQRRMWRDAWSPWYAIPALLAATYAMSVVNNALGFALTDALGSQQAQPLRWQRAFVGVDDCWLALIAYCAANALVGHYHALKEEQRRHGQALLAAREAELRALRYQLNPHFLFNTLNGVSALVAEGRGGEARTMLARLGAFLRVTLEGQAHAVALAEELALTETYLSIEQARLGERLQVHWNIGPGVLDAEVPSLLLQPLVENAIRHGIARRSKPGRVSVDIQARGARLCARVANDGADAAGGAASNGQSLGQSNVRARLAHLYAQQHRFSAEADAAGGYEVSIEIPLRRVRASAEDA